MSIWQVMLPWLPPMLILATLSGLFSGSEAALFSLRDKDLKNLQRRGTSGRLVVKLLERPERLLSAILFWNLLVNMTFFGVAGIVAGNLEKGVENGARTAIIFTVLMLFFLIFFSEMLPKSIAVLIPKRIALAIAFPMTIAVRIISPALPLIGVVNLGVQRLLWPSFTSEPDLDLEDIGRAIELGTDDAALAKQEQAALRNLVQLADLRIDECMRPRSQLMLVRKPIASKSFANQLPPGGYAFIIEGDADEIVGSIAIARMRPNQFFDLDAVVEPVCYVPWAANVSTVLELLQRQHLSTAVIVNEIGESIGVVSVEDVMRHVLTGRFEHINLDSQQPIETVGEGHYRASGAMGVRKLAKFLEIAPPEGRTATLAGLMQRINGRPPRLSDTCQWNQFILEVIHEPQEGGCILEIRHVDAIGESSSPVATVPAHETNQTMEGPTQ